MTRERLQSISLEELEALARNEGYEFTGVTDRAALIDFILDNFEELKKERQKENNASVRVEESKYEITDGAAREPATAVQVPISKRYNQTKIVLMVRDPNWAFAYWDMEDALLEKLKKGSESEQFVLRVHDVEMVDFNGANSNSWFDIPIALEDSSWYIYLPHQDCHYLLELCLLTGGKTLCLARSNPIKTPRDSYAEMAEDPVDQEAAGNLLLGLEIFKAYAGSEGIPQRILSVARE